MKKLITLLLGLGLLNSCFLKKKQSENLDLQKIVVAEKIIQDTTITRFLNIKQDSSDFVIHYNYFLKEDEIWKRAANSYVADFIFTSTHFEQDTISKFKISDDFVIKCLDTFYKAAEQDYYESEFPILWFYDGSSTILSNNSKFLSLSSHAFTFTGGAHPNAYHEFVNFDKNTGNILKLRDIVTDTVAYYKLAEKFFREAIQAQEYEDLNELGYWFSESGFFCNDNFYISENELVFYFNTYEIAPYSHGPTEFSVPFTLSKHLFKLDLSKK
jgi:hypothetical protein